MTPGTAIPYNSILQTTRMQRWLNPLIPCACLVALLAYVVWGPRSQENGEEPPIAKADSNTPVRTIGGEPLILVSISPESRVKASTGAAKPILEQGAWTEFPIEIENAARITSPLFIESAQLMQSDDDLARDRWLKIELDPSGPLTGALNERRSVRLWSRDRGKRAAVLNVNAGQGTQDLGFRSDVLITFDVAPPTAAAGDSQGS